MLDGARDADREVDLGGHHAAGLADLARVGHHARVADGARAADGGPQGVREVLDELDALGALHAAAAGHDDVGLAEVDLVRGLLEDLAQHDAQVGARGLELHDVGAASGLVGELEGAGLGGHDGHVALEGDLVHDLARVGQALDRDLAAVDRDGLGVGHRPRAEASGEARSQVLAELRAADQHELGAALLGGIGDGLGEGHGLVALEAGVIGHVDGRSAVGGELVGEARHARADHDGRGLETPATALAQQLEADLLEAVALGFSDD
ncbi:hypothetical protein D3C86_1209990 [compost metagenome]